MPAAAPADDVPVQDAGAPAGGRPPDAGPGASRDGGADPDPPDPAQVAVALDAAPKKAFKGR